MIASMRVLLQYIDVTYETAEDAVEYALSDFVGTPQEFTLLQQHYCPSFYQLSKRVRIKLAIQIIHNHLSSYFEPELIRTIIGMDDLAAADINGIHPSCTIQSTLIHIIARKTGTCQRCLQGLDHIQRKQLACDSYVDLLRELLRLGADAHTVVDNMTPFQAFLQGYFGESTLPQFQTGNDACNSAIQTWLGNLEAVGIDLAVYGETEQYNWMNTASRREFNGWDIEEQANDTQRVTGFSYGTSPADWHMWMAEPSDPFVGQFWEMVERSMEEMPGSWPER